MYDVLNAYLENGLKVILHKIADVKTMSCGLWIRQGSVYETYENNGLSHLLEHLVLNPQDVKNEEYCKLMEQVASEGVIYNASTTKEYTCFYFTGRENALANCLMSLSHIARNNRDFVEELFENEKSVVIQEATSFYSSYQQIKERTSQAIWGNRGTGKIIMGDMKNITSAKMGDVQQILEKAYVPENATVIVVGNIDYQKTLQMIEDCFGTWKDRKGLIAEIPVENVPGIYLNRGSGNSAVFSIGFRSPAYGALERPAVEMMVRMLGQSGMQSRIVQEIRVKRGLSYTLGGFSSFYKNRGTVGFMAVCDKAKAVEAAKVMMDVLITAKEKGFSEEEIQREKNIMETAVLLAVDNITEHLRCIGKCSIMDRNFYIENEVRAIRNIQKEDIAKVATEVLQESNMGLAAIGDNDFDELLDAVSFT